VVAISPDRPETMVASLKDPNLGYDLYSDASMQASRAFGIAFELSASEFTRYKGYGIDLEETSGQPHHQLPVPSVFLVEAGGTIRWVYSNPDYKVRPANEQLMSAARAIAARETD
jgi:peroxiredoxin